MLNNSLSVNAILFDFGGVLAEEGFFNSLQALAQEQHLDVNLPEEGMRAVYDSGFVLGRGSESDFWTLLRQRTGLNGSDKELTRRVLDGFRLRPGMLALVQTLRQQGFLVGLLSDQTEWLDRLDAKYGLYQEFDRLYISCRLGKGKRDPSLYDDVARDLGLEPQQILFIDDNQGNIQRAASQGWQTILFRDERTLRLALRGRGLLGPETE